MRYYFVLFSLILSEVVFASLEVHLYEHSGNKQYQLENHLSNILVILNESISPLDDNNDGSVDNFNSNLINTSDYSP